MEPYPGDSIMPAAKEFDGIDGDLADYAWTFGSYWTEKWPYASAFHFVVNGLSPMEYYVWWVEGKGMELAQRMVKDYNVKFIETTGCLLPAECFLQSSVPLKTLDDIEGLKIRTAGDDGEIFARMGAAVVSVSGGELYEAMQRGVVDAFQFSTPSIDWSYGFHEVVKYTYLSPVRQPADCYACIVNPKSWEKLPSDLQGLVVAVTTRAAFRFYAEVLRTDVEAIQKYLDYGISVEPASKEIEQEMTRLADAFYAEKAAKDPFWAEVLDSIQAVKKTYREGWPRL